MADVLLVDGHNVVFRSYYGVGELSREDGFPTGAIYGYVNAIWRLQDRICPGRTTVFFDMGRSEKRTAILPEYKANRQPIAEELRVQLPHICRLAVLMGCSVVQRPGVEADDLIAAHAVGEAAMGNRVAIASSDKDFAQLVCDAITLWSPPPPGSYGADWIALDPAAVERKFSVAPEQIVDYLCLVGDASDNVRGVPRIGAKTAARLLQTYGTIDGIMEHLHELPKSIGENMLNSSAEIARNRELIAFDRDGEIVQPQVGDFDLEALISFFEEFDLQSFIPKAIKRYGAKKQKTEPKNVDCPMQSCLPF
ncbi:MAG: hypothetical protein LBB38_04255 [Puniceicoccales bacterium]|jgi:DNA polymerase-1|nr:hypothetical protein [Puniceicoccales bacterium]